jgi:ketosteroid isomerase-like protein
MLYSVIRYKSNTVDRTMKRSGSLIGCVAFLGATAACTSTPTDTRQADIQAVKDVEAAWVRDAALKNPARMASYYSAVDAVVLFPNSPPINGRDHIQGAFTTLMHDPNFALSFESTKADASKGGDMVYTVGTYILTRSDPKDQKPVTDKGKYMTLFRKQADGTWKAVADMLNSDLPAHASTH